MNREQLHTIIEGLNAFDYGIITLNLLLILFAAPLLRRFLSNGKNDQHFTLRLNLLRGINVFILATYGYKEVYEPQTLQGPAFTTITILAILYLTYIGNFFLQFLIHKHYGRAREIGEQTIYVQTYQSRLLSILAAIILTLIALIAIVRTLGFESLLEAGGVLGFIGVLLALTQGSWAPDIISGLIILNSDMFEEGDIVEIEGVIGRVYRTKIFHTEIINLRNNHRMMLRNAKMRDSTIQNLSKFATGMGLRECLKFNIGYEVRSAEIKAMLSRAYERAHASGCQIETNPAPQVKVLETGDHAIVWGLLFHIKKVEQLIHVRRDLREAVLDEAQASGIDLATPLTHTLNNQGAGIELP